MKKLLFALAVVFAMSFSTIVFAADQDARGDKQESVSVQHVHTDSCGHSVAVVDIDADARDVALVAYACDENDLTLGRAGPLTGAVDNYCNYKELDNQITLSTIRETKWSKTIWKKANIPR